MARSCLFLLLVHACTSETGTRSGTSVGNPTRVGLTAAQTTDVQITQGLLGVDAVLLDSCNNTERARLSRPNGFGLGEWVDVPDGQWCTTTLLVTGPLTIDTIVDDQPVGIDLDLSENLTLPGEWQADSDGRQYIIEIAEPDWLADVREAAREGTDYFGPDHPLASQLASSVVAHTGLYRDRDGDGEVSASEREAVARDSRNEDDREARCGEVWGETFRSCIEEGREERECTMLADDAFETCMEG